jgi:hydroxymethylbilane synthase
LPDGLTLAAIPEREDVRDAIIGSTLDALPQGALVGTSSLRRTAQLRALRPDLKVESVRGNVDTRLRKLDEGQYQAIMLAAAGLRRLGWADRIAQYIDPAVMCPAVGQGALAIETRTDRVEVAVSLEHRDTRVAVTAERALLGALGGGCQVPIGANATVDGDTVHLRGIVAAPDGSNVVRGNLSGHASEAAAIGKTLAEQLMAQGAKELLLQAS